jgi:hypothetical protein
MNNPKVVQGDARAEVPQLLQSDGDRIGVRQHSGFGDFKLESIRRQAWKESILFGISDAPLDLLSTYSKSLIKN